MVSNEKKNIDISQIPNISAVNIIKQSIDSNIKRIMTPRQTYKYDKESNLPLKWISIEKDCLEIITNKEVTFLTYNVWFSEHNFNNRIIAIAKIFEKYSPDFICIQEATDKLIKYLQGLPFIQENYYMSESSLISYDVVILSKYYVRFYYVPFSTSQSRNLTFAETYLISENNFIESALIGTAHFESKTNNQHKRISQLKLSFETLNFADIGFLMGDFNFDPMDPEESSIDESWNDSWKIFKSKNLKLTEEDGITRPPEKYKNVRYDRIYYKHKYNNLKLLEFEITGKEEIEIENDKNLTPIKTPSDHLAVYTKFLFN